MTQQSAATPLFPWSFIIIIGVLALTAGLAGIYLPGAWYAGLAKPDWAAPSWVLAPVWFTLYILIAVAYRLIGNQPAARLARWAWVAQIIFVSAWSLLFFAFHRIDLALADVVLLWLSILAFILLAWQHSRMAALLFVPYLAWVSYAGAMNWAFWSMNN
jgi:translocator protein